MVVEEINKRILYTFEEIRIALGLPESTTIDNISTITNYTKEEQGKFKNVDVIVQTSETVDPESDK